MHKIAPDKHPLGWWQFYISLLGKVIRHPWGLSESIATAIGLLIPVILRFRPKLEARLTPLTWEIPVGILASLSVVRLFLAPYWMYRDRHDAAKEHESTLTASHEAAIAELRKEIKRAEEKVAAERALNEQPDVALVWDIIEDEKKFQNPLQRALFNRDILVENRDPQYTVYNVQVSPIALKQTMEFESINEIKPGKQHKTLCRWDGRSSLTVELAYFFMNEENEAEAVRLGMMQEKLHNRGMSPNFLKIPMSLTYEARNRAWRSDFEFIYDIGLESMFVKRLPTQPHQK